MCIYLAYYKDVIFSLITLVNFIGMYINSKQIDISHEYVSNCLIALISISSFFILMTIIHDYDKAFYLKYKLYFRKFNNLEIDKVKLQKSSKNNSNTGQNKDNTANINNENQFYERSQSFAVWLQFQNIQSKKVQTGDTDSMDSSEIGD